MARVRTQRDMLSMAALIEYSGYTRAVAMGAYKRGELKGERPGRSPKAPLYFDRVEVDRWLDSLAEDAS